MIYKLQLLALSIAIVTPAMASETDDIERITVNSGFRTQGIQQLSSSVSVIPELAIQNRQAQHVEEILNMAANLNFASGASRGRFIQIRGIGERSQFSEPVNPSVGFIIDDFDFSGIAGVGTLFDVDQVEIFRGPQATAFGASAMAGLVSIKTVEADDNQQTRLHASIAQQNTWSLGAAHGGALSDSLFYRVAVQQYKSDGFIKNAFLGREDTDNLDEFTSRLKLKYIVSEDLTLDLNYQYFDIDNGYDAFSLDNDGITQSDEPGFDRQETHALGLKGTYNTSWGQLLVIASHSTSELGYGYDEDWTFDGFHPDGYSSTDHYFRDLDTTSIDIRAVSNESSALFDGKTQWVAGVYAKSSEQSLMREYTFAASDFSSEYEPTSKALYVQTDTRLSDSFILHAGLRLDSFEIDYTDSSGFTSTNDDTMLGGKLVLDYVINGTTLYAGVSRGYKAGGFNPDERVSQQNRIFEPEFNWNYEFGVKGRFADDDAFIRMAVFYMDREDTQVSDFDVQTRDDGSATFIDVIGNADTGTNWGVEFESSWQANDALLLTANFGYLDATFSDYVLANGDLVAKQEQAQSPKRTFNVAAQLMLTEQLIWRVEVDGKDDFRFSDGHDERSPSFELVNTRLSYELENWTASVWVKNLLDETYFVRGFGGFSNDPRDGYFPAEPYFQLGDGRQAGVSLDYRF